MAGVSMFSLKTFIFRLPVDLGVLVRSADGGDIESGGPLPLGVLQVLPPCL